MPLSLHAKYTAALKEIESLKAVVKAQELIADGDFKHEGELEKQLAAMEEQRRVNAARWQEQKRRMIFLLDCSTFVAHAEPVEVRWYVESAQEDMARARAKAKKMEEKAELVGKMLSATVDDCIVMKNSLTQDEDGFLEYAESAMKRIDKRWKKYVAEVKYDES
jgi:hypothetical protein